MMAVVPLWHRGRRVRRDATHT